MGGEERVKGVGDGIPPCVVMAGCGSKSEALKAVALGSAHFPTDCSPCKYMHFASWSLYAFVLSPRPASVPRKK